jgi:tRNA uridine 5-carbamoylmethylation protein Kti12
MFLFDTQIQCNDMRNAVMLYKNTEKTTDIPDETLNKIYELQMERNKTQKW